MPSAAQTHALAQAQLHAQVAVAVELYTIPFYISAAASVKDTNSDAYNILRGIFLEEMFHLQLAANICVALGTTPNFTAPVYGTTPTFPDGTPILKPYDPATGDGGALNVQIGNLLDALSKMLDIETPTEFEADASAPPYHSIGQLYAALLNWVALAGDAVPWSTENQQDHGIGVRDPAFRPLITTEAELHAAVDVICAQGEGQAQSPAPVPPLDPNEFLVPEADFTFTKKFLVLGVEYSHFGRLLRIAQMNLTPDAVCWGTANPTDPNNICLQKTFAVLIDTLNQAWKGGSPGLGVMTTTLTQARAAWQAGVIPCWTA